MLLGSATKRATSADRSPAHLLGTDDPRVVPQLVALVGDHIEHLVDRRVDRDLTSDASHRDPPSQIPASATCQCRSGHLAPNHLKQRLPSGQERPQDTDDLACLFILGVVARTVDDHELRPRNAGRQLVLALRPKHEVLPA
jgi:hypothetical protein